MNLITYVYARDGHRTLLRLSKTIITFSESPRTLPFRQHQRSFCLKSRRERLQKGAALNKTKPDICHNKSQRLEDCLPGDTASENRQFSISAYVPFDVSEQKHRLCLKTRVLDDCSIKRKDDKGLSPRHASSETCDTDSPSCWSGSAVHHFIGVHQQDAIRLSDSIKHKDDTGLRPRHTSPGTCNTDSPSCWSGSAVHHFIGAHQQDAIRLSGSIDDGRMFSHQQRLCHTLLELHNGRRRPDSFPLPHSVRLKLHPSSPCFTLHNPSFAWSSQQRYFHACFTTFRRPGEKSCRNGIKGVGTCSSPRGLLDADTTTRQHPGEARFHDPTRTLSCRRERQFHTCGPKTPDLLTRSPDETRPHNPTWTLSCRQERQFHTCRTKTPDHLTHSPDEIRPHNPTWTLSCRRERLFHTCRTKTPDLLTRSSPDETRPHNPLWTLSGPERLFHTCVTVTPHSLTCRSGETSPCSWMPVRNASHAPAKNMRIPMAYAEEINEVLDQHHDVIQEFAQVLGCRAGQVREMVRHDTRLLTYSKHGTMDKMKLLLQHGYAPSEIMGRYQVLVRSLDHIRACLTALEPVKHYRRHLYLLLLSGSRFRSCIAAYQQEVDVMGPHSSQASFVAELLQCSQREVESLARRKHCDLLLTRPPSRLKEMVGILGGYGVGVTAIREQPLMLRCRPEMAKERLEKVRQVGVLTPRRIPFCLNNSDAHFRACLATWVSNAQALGHHHKNVVVTSPKVRQAGVLTPRRIPFCLNNSDAHFHACLATWVSNAQALGLHPDTRSLLKARLGCSEGQLNDMLQRKALVGRLSAVKLTGCLDVLLGEVGLSPATLLRHGDLLYLSARRSGSRWSLLCHLGLSEMALVNELLLSERKFVAKYGVGSD